MDTEPKDCALNRDTKLGSSCVLRSVGYKADVEMPPFFTFEHRLSY